MNTEEHRLKINFHICKEDILCSMNGIFLLQSILIDNGEEHFHIDAFIGYCTFDIGILLIKIRLTIPIYIT